MSPAAVRHVPRVSAAAFCDGEKATIWLTSMIHCQSLNNKLLVLWSEESRLSGEILHSEKGSQSHHDRQSSFNEKDPTPRCQSSLSTEETDAIGYQTSKRSCESGRGKEQTDPKVLSAGNTFFIQRGMI